MPLQQPMERLAVDSWSASLVVPAAFTRFLKACEHCKKPMLITCARAITRKRFCSRSCLALALVAGRNKGRHISSINMRGKCHTLSPKLLEAQRLRGLAMRGEKSVAWKSGITPLTRLRVNRSSWRTLAASIRERDGKQCVYCNRRDCVLAVHHIEEWNGENDIPENLITLCRLCHGVTHRGMGIRNARSISISA